MIRVVCTAMAMMVLWGEVAAAASQFPYEAVVQSESAQVRSHNSQRSAVTNQLAMGAHVVVYAHQPGGWYKIVPPEGSFSLIPKSMVETRPDLFGKGIVLQNNAPAYMGSAVGEASTGVHSKLSKNDEVTIIGATTVNTQRGPVEMYKIKPPAYEYRWIEGHHLIPADQLTEEGAGNPFALQQPEAYSPAPEKVDPFQQTASRNEAQSTAKTTVVKSQPTPAASNSKGVRRSAPPVDVVEADRTALHELDLAFKEMIELDPAEWDLDGLEAAYTELQSGTKYRVIASQVDLRLGAVKRYRTIKSEYDSFIQLTSATSEREAELRRQQQQVATTVGTSADNYGEPTIADPTATEPTEISSVDSYLESGEGPILGGPQFRPVQQPTEIGAVEQEGPQGSTPATIVSRPVPSSPQGDLISGPQIMARPTPAGGPTLGAPTIGSTMSPEPTSPVPAALEQPVPTPRSQQQLPAQPQMQAQQQPLQAQPQPPVDQLAESEGGVPEFDGAGIIQRSLNPRPGYPQHVLTSPGGEIISYIHPRGALNLDQYIGKSMGIQGEVQFSRELNRHVLIIDRMMPVQLTQ